MLRPVQRTRESIMAAMRVTLCRTCNVTLFRCWRNPQEDCCARCDHRLGVLPQEPGIGWQVVEESGHTFTRAEDGNWYCSCDGNDAWEWLDVVSDVGKHAYSKRLLAEVRSPLSP